MIVELKNDETGLALKPACQNILKSKLRRTILMAQYNNSYPRVFKGLKTLRRNILFFDQFIYFVTFWDRLI